MEACTCGACAAGFARLLQGSRTERKPALVQGDFVLLALFDGIRGCSVALQSLGVEPSADYSSEVEKNCQRLTAAKYPKAVQLGDIEKLDKETLEGLVLRHGKKPWLVVGGSPCQDLSKRRGPLRKGLAGKKSKLFFEYLRVVSTLMNLGVQVAFLLENVESMADEDRNVITECLGVEPVAIDSVIVSACHRSRYYWTNLHISPLEPQSVDVDSLLDEGWRRFPEDKPFRCFVASSTRNARLGREAASVRRDADGAERVPNADEREAILGFPRGHTRLKAPDGEDLFPEGLRLKLLGNSFSIQVVAHLLSSLAACVKAGKPLELQPLKPNARLLRMERFMPSDAGEEATDVALDWED